MNLIYLVSAGLCCHHASGNGGSTSMALGGMGVWLPRGWGPADFVWNAAGIIKEVCLDELPCPFLLFLGPLHLCGLVFPDFRFLWDPARSERWQKRNAENSLLTALQVPVPYFSPPLRVILALKFPAGEIGKMCLFHLV